MKKYTTFPSDFATVATDAMAYLNQTTDVEDVEHQTTAFHWIGDGETAIASIPSLADSTDGLTILGAAHRTVMINAMFNHVATRDILFVPLNDCESTVLKLFSVAEGAILNEAGNYYDDGDCTVTDTIPMTSATFIPSGSVFTLETTDLSKLSDILELAFVEDTSSYFAE